MTTRFRSVVDSVTSRLVDAGSLGPPWMANVLSTSARLADPTWSPRRRWSPSSSSTTPGSWFDETLASLARQDYPALDTVFLRRPAPATATSTSSPTSSTPCSRTPSSRRSAGNPGFGPAANSARQFVEGDNGFFCFCHDDVALDPDAVRLMVEELYRSNAGIVGPKLVAWDNPRVLQNVGLDVDRFGATRRPGRASVRSIRSNSTPSATCSPCRRPACSCAPTCSAPSVASTRR